MIKRTLGLGSLVAFCATILSLQVSVCDTRPALKEQEHWTMQLETRLGSVDGDDAFSLLIGARFGPANSIYVLQPLDANVRVHDLATGERRVIGRRGFGPGEFVETTALGWYGPNLWVVDAQQGRISWFDAFGTLIRTTTPRRSIPEGYVAVPRIVAPLSNDMMLLDMLAHVLPGNAGSPFKRFAVSDTAGMITHELFRLANTHSRLAVMNPRLPGRGLFARQPFGDDPLMSVDPAGEFIAVVDRPVAVDERLGAYSVTRYAPNGDTVWSVQRSYRPVPLGQNTVDAFSNDFVESVLKARGPGIRSRSEAEVAVKAALYRPRFLPPVSNVLVGSDGRIWVQRNHGDTDSSRWDVFSPEGKLLGEVSGPAGITLLDSRDNRVLGVTKGAFDEPYMEVHRLVERSRSDASN